MKYVGLVLVTLGLVWGLARPDPAPVAPRPATPNVTPQPDPICPGPDCPNRPRRPWGPRNGAGRSQSLRVSITPTGNVTIGGPSSPDGTEEVTADLPVTQRIHNVPSRVDGAGMCVMSSIEMMFRYHSQDQYRGLRDWCAQQPGGGYPQKVDDQIRAFCQARNVPAPSYFQYEGQDLNILRQALLTQRMVAVTYSGQDGVRYRGRIYHMVCLVHLSSRWAAILDNNGIGENELLWMTPQDFQQRWVQGQNGWAVICTSAPPPPAPHN